ncbi:copper resistance protein NlpE N-terminal domain-containing protein [Halomonas sp. NCCP-2165]|nr:copper resistance protein NlpE N-terminal domain-containing protein [Halomonas sp. NCCP-2165]GKW48335.1 hypothetical protein NCCP2165_05500 [Halomonas sp. NCCP-2165]
MRTPMMLAGAALALTLAGCAAGPMESQNGAGVTDGETAYQGSLPCRNCAGIDLDVRLQGEMPSAQAMERTFTLQASYREHPQSPPDENYAGNWEILSGTASDPEATVYELTPEGEGQVYYFLKLDEQTLELIDPQRRRFQNSEMLRLRRL